MTEYDPFDAPVSDEPTLATNSTISPWEDNPKSADSFSVDVKPNLLPIDAGKVVLTFKGGTGFDAPWIVIHATDLQDAYNQTTGENATLLASVMSQVHKAGAHFTSNGPVNTGRGGNTGARSNAPQGATEAPSYAPPKPFDDFVYKSGVSKAGKAWEAWMPPQKGDTREPKFFYKN